MKSPIMIAYIVSLVCVRVLCEQGWGHKTFFSRAYHHDVAAGVEAMENYFFVDISKGSI